MSAREPETRDRDREPCRRGEEHAAGLSNILLTTDGGRLRLQSTNLELGITCWIGAKIEDEGAITVPAKLLADFIGNLPNDTVTLTLDERTQTVNVHCARSDANIKGIEADEFPTIPVVQADTPT